MDADDAPILRFVFRNFCPQRHLEFGTWKGKGALHCLQECNATVWTINLPEGERKADGSLAYWEAADPIRPARWRRGVWERLFGRRSGAPAVQTDAGELIGVRYREAGFGCRVCQIYCDSRQWDTSNYQTDFFDSVLVDGGHTRDVVLNDTRKGLELLRPGGMILWHDFCLDKEVRERFESARSVTQTILDNWDWISADLKDAFWIKPSWILLGIRK